MGGDFVIWHEGARPLSRLFIGAATPALGDALFRFAGVGGLSRPLSRLEEDEARRLAGSISDLRLMVTGVKGFDAAQVTAGGLAAEQFNSDTLESRIMPGLFATGEILDVDGDCGGYNLMFAVASGLAAGRG